MERFTVHAIVHYAHANMLDHTKDYEETKRVYIEMHKIELDVKKTKKRCIRSNLMSRRQRSMEGSASSSYSIIAEKKGIEPTRLALV
ncbi:hypothetical protein F2Q69_00041095 [Brassica cretica]|uniref:Uncharacterized protein n=1 Tax=Brassica cretica TaxID=69181 RepID=A0A8S9NIL0_BRACR|nr:hypothetical protein F2Q69_00041095 [Brassica cretica]